MNLFTMLLRKAPNRVFASTLFGILSGAVYSIMIPLITTALKGEDWHLQTVEAAKSYFPNMDIANSNIALVFTLGCIFIMVCRIFSQVTLTDTAIDLASDLRSDLYKKIADAPLSSLERLGIPRLIAAMTQDIPAVISGAQMLPDLLVSVVTVAGMLVFLLYLNAGIFWFVLISIIFGAATYQVPILFGRKFFIRSRTIGDCLNSAIHGLVNGMKELKLNDEKRNVFFESMLLSYEKQLLNHSKSANRITRIASNYGEMLSFFIIGILAFIFKDYHSVSNSELLGGIMVLLYIAGPIAAILQAIPVVINAKIAIDRFSAVASQLSDEDICKPPAPMAAWDSIRFEKVCYRHSQSGDDRAFKVGPVDLEFRKGQVTFIVGGNGSGKSTLCKLLTLHYTPTSGKIFFGDALVSRETVSACRQNIVAIYSDYYLFDSLLGVTCPPETVDHYLRALKLEGKVRYENGKFSTLSLSDGQRRRLALLVAFVENKELYLFDEWAADQDPGFKEIFYHEILPSLKARGKAVVAITHDDRYFHVADKIIVMEDGLVSEINAGKEGADTASIRLSTSTFMHH